jgi:hypothetical protein
LPTRCVIVIIHKAILRHGPYSSLTHFLVSPCPSFLTKFVEELPNAQLQWIEECGHVPHLEQPKETAEAIASFLTMSTSFKSGSKIKTIPTGGAVEGSNPSSTYYIGGGVVGALLLEELIKQFF